MHSQNTDNATILELKARLLKAELQRNERLSDEYNTLYDLLYLSGLTWPENLWELAVDEHNQPKTNALWVWQSWDIINNSEKATSLVQYCKNNFINKVFLSVNKRCIRISKTSIVSCRLRTESNYSGAFNHHPGWYSSPKITIRGHVRSHP